MINKTQDKSIDYKQFTYMILQWHRNVQEQKVWGIPNLLQLKHEALILLGCLRVHSSQQGSETRSPSQLIFNHGYSSWHSLAKQRTPANSIMYYLKMLSNYQTFTQNKWIRSWLCGLLMSSHQFPNSKTLDSTWSKDSNNSQAK